MPMRHLRPFDSCTLPPFDGAAPRSRPVTFSPFHPSTFSPFGAARKFSVTNDFNPRFTLNLPSLPPQVLIHTKLTKTGEGGGWGPARGYRPGGCLTD